MFLLLLTVELNITLVTHLMHLCPMSRGGFTMRQMRQARGPHQNFNVEFLKSGLFNGFN